MSPNSWIEQNYKTIRKSVINISGNDSLADDLLSECILILLEKPNVQAIVDSGGCLFYFIRIVMNQWKSSTSPFHKTYRRTFALEVNDQIADTTPYDHEFEDKLMKELDNVNWYSAKLFELNVFDKESISKISRETKIPRASITLEIKRVKKHLRDKAEELLKD